MLSSKEMMSFMPKEEIKVRKWARKELRYENMAAQSDRYIRETTGRDANSIEKNIFYRNCYCLFKALAEKAHKKKEIWYERLISAGQKENMNNNAESL